MDPDRPIDVLQDLLADIDELGLDPSAHLIVRRTREAHAAGLADSLEPRRDVDALAQDILAIDQDIAEIDADPVEDALGLRQRSVALIHHLLDEDRAFDRRNDRREFQQHAVAHGLDQPAAQGLHNRRPGVAPFAHEFDRPSLILAHQARITDHVRGEDGREPARLAHCASLAIFETISREY
jgi:hypothetical protein